MEFVFFLWNLFSRSAAVHMVCTPQIHHPNPAVYSIPHFLRDVNTCSKVFLKFFVVLRNFFISNAAWLRNFRSRPVVPPAESVPQLCQKRNTGVSICAKDGIRALLSVRNWRISPYFSENVSVRAKKFKNLSLNCYPLSGIIYHRKILIPEKEILNSSNDIS